MAVSRSGKSFPGKANAAVKPKPRPSTRAFKTKAFARLARKDGLADEELCKAVCELEEGKGDDLGGNVWKKRIDKNRARAIVATKPGAFWVFTYLFSKKDRENIDPDELAAFKKLAEDYGHAGLVGAEKLVANGSMVEICNDCEDEQHEEGAPEERAKNGAPPARGRKTQKRGHGGHPRIGGRP
jgi:hypothetical protein